MNVLIGGAWPYANGSLHIGHIAALLPGDVLDLHIHHDEIISGIKVFVLDVFDINHLICSLLFPAYFLTTFLLIFFKEEISDTTPKKGNNNYDNWNNLIHKIPPQDTRKHS